MSEANDEMFESIEPEEFSSERGLDYTRLCDLLAAGKWEEANT